MYDFVVLSFKYYYYVKFLRLSLNLMVFNLKDRIFEVLCIKMTWCLPVIVYVIYI